ncbi:MULTISPECIES: alpha/beta fold hydrolase [Ramlibacter]|uniref:Alpha/beta fold hydrolase n=1 Tax=Ramlibacter aquaticus TaxID=2780094 RepID=A0ABR9S9Q8_9BURK|nr:MULTISPECIES: alpha/beta fold hydrolase [Ramlibacter]MBE7939084.1 alpha/beta fold hydrolase [Ramlibacter aquaticus]
MNASNASHPEFQSRTVTVGGKRLAARVGGSGTPIVLFHSLLADSSSFDRILPALAATHQVVVLELPGFGQSEAVGGKLEDIADHIAGGIAAMGLPKPLLLGNGYGGFIALMTAIRHPQLAARLVLADCGACFSEPGRAAFRGMSANAREKGLGAIADVAMRRLFAPEFQQQNPDLVAARKERFLAVDPATFHGACEALATLDVRDKLAGVKTPALVLVGEQDEATPPPMSKELAAGLPDARLEILTGCAHVPQLQAPGQFMDAISGFIAG